ncbi:MAG: glycoside hydrolase family 36 protein [Anaerolineae bacterium]
MTPTRRRTALIGSRPLKQWLARASDWLNSFCAFLQWSAAYYRWLWRELWTRWRAVSPVEPAGSPLPPIPPAPQRSPSMSSTDESLFLQDRLVFHPQTGKLDFIFEGEAVLENCSASLSYIIGDQRRNLLITPGAFAYKVAEDGLELSQADEHVLLTWHVRLAGDIEAWLEVRNLSASPLQIERLNVLELNTTAGGRLNLGAAPRRWSVYQNGWQSWSPAFARRLTQGIHTRPDSEQYARYHLPHGDPDAGGEISSEWFTVLSAWGGRRARGASALLLGFITTADQLAEIRLRADAEAFQALRAACYADGFPQAPGETLQSERLAIAAGREPLSLLERYTARVGELMGARLPAHIPTGWCTWYYFFGENTQQDVLDNLAELTRESLPLDYVLIDDGYQRAIGDWLTPNPERFGDIADLVRTIHAEGRRAGIWLAPFGLEPESLTFREHPDWVVRDDAGAPVVAWQHFGRDVYALDLSRPEVLEWLSTVFRTMRQEWGVDLFKVDFLFAGCAPGRRHDPRFSRAQLLRRGLAAIRQAIGDEAFLLACGAPLGPCIGLADGMRVGPDVAANWHPFWPDLSMPAAENALRNSITRYFTHGRLWLNDPDCVLLRDRDDQSDLALNEIRTLVSVVALLGGLTISSDNLPTLRKGRLKYLQQILPPTGISAVPLDLFEHELPQCLALPVRRPWGEWLVAAVINWEDRIQTTEIDLEAMGLPAGDYHVFHYWPRRYMGISQGQLTLERHLPHETVVLLFKPASDEPDILTTTFHVAQTLSEVASVERTQGEDGRRRLIILLERPGSQFGEVWFTFPPALKISGARVNGRKRQVTLHSVGVAHLGLTLNERARIEIDFEPFDPQEGDAPP